MIGLHPGGARRLVELDHAEQVGGVGQRQRRHAVGPGARDRVVDAHDAVAHRVLAVQPQVNETRRPHVKKIYRKGRHETPYPCPPDSWLLRCDRHRQPNRSAELDKAYEETRAAYLALQEAEKRRDAGRRVEAGERLGSAAGGASRPNDQYSARQAQLEQEVELARRRYEAAQKRWNDLK